MVEPVDDCKCHGFSSNTFKTSRLFQSCTAPNSKFTKNVAEFYWIDQRTPKGLEVFC